MKSQQVSESTINKRDRNGRKHEESLKGTEVVRNPGGAEV